MSIQCMVEDCDKPQNTSGYCRAHYSRFKRYGDPLAGKPTPGRGLKFIQEIVMNYHGDDCLKWPYGTVETGSERPSMWMNNKHVIPARVVCTMAHGEPPDPSMHAAHSCGNGHLGCVNKQHLRWATAAENAADMVIHGTQIRGEASAWAKLEEVDVQMIRTLADAGFSQRKISKRFGVSNQQVSRIVRGKKWSWLEAPRSPDAGREGANNE